MGSIGNASNNTSTTATPSPIVVSYDIEDEAMRKGFDSAQAMVEYDLTEPGEFWTRDDEMVEFVEDLGYTVISSPNGESFTITDDNDNSDAEFIVYYERGGSSRYITRVREV